MTEWMMPPLNVWQGTGKSPARAGVRHNMVVPYGAYRCADGDVLLAVQTDREWRRLCTQVLDSPALADDPRFVINELRVANRVALEVADRRALLSCARANRSSRCSRPRIFPTGAMNDVAAVGAHPQLAARGRWVERRFTGGRILRAPSAAQSSGRAAAHGRGARTWRAHARNSRRADRREVRYSSSTRDDDLGLTGFVVAHAHAPRLAADFAVFDVLLRRPAPRIDRDLDFFCAIWAQHRRFGLRGAVAFGKLIVQIFVVVTHGI